MLIASIGFSQRDFRPGFIVTTQGERQSGWVNYREGPISHHSCEYRKTKSGPTQVFNPSEISGYGFNDDRFYTTKEYRLDSLSASTAFFELILEGKVSLFRFQKDYWIQKEQGPMQQLKIVKRKITRNGDTFVKNTNQHLGILNIVLSDCAELRGTYDEIKLEEKPLFALIQKYNEYKNSPFTVFKAKKPWIKVTAGALAGVQRSDINLLRLGDAYEDLGTSYVPHTSFTSGISLQVYQPRVSERFSFQADLLYSTATLYGYNIVGMTLGSRVNYITIETTQVKIPFGSNFVFASNRRFTPFVGGGFIAALNLKSSFNWVQESVLNQSLVFTNEIPALPILPAQLGFWGGVGVFARVHKDFHFSVQVRQEFSDAVSPLFVSPQLRSNRNALQLLFGFHLR